MAPAALGAGLATWLIVFMISRYVSLASIAAAIVIPIYAWIMYRSDGILIPVILTFLGVLAIIRHRGNLARLMAGTENRFRSGKKK